MVDQLALGGSVDLYRGEVLRDGQESVECESLGLAEQVLASRLVSLICIVLVCSSSSPGLFHLEEP